ncbi:MAG TPA: OmpA family protein [Bryobacteraceae bacterium]|nr:OmpA family protein [Bryobacteraceae bacterium]
MKHIFATSMILTGAMLAGGCATKKYVRNTTAPIQAKVDQVGEQTAKNGQSIEQTKTDLKSVDDKAQAGIGAAKEAAQSADSHASEAMTKANQVGEMATKTNQDLNGLKQVVANLDDFKQAKEVTIPFKFDKYRLTDDDRAQLDQLVSDVTQYKRYFITVKGYTDQIGSASYNEGLSRRRADAVVEYLVGKHNIPLYRIHMLGLGEMNPIDPATTREARAKNRRVEVKVYSADQAMAQLQARQ